MSAIEPAATDVAPTITFDNVSKWFGAVVAVSDVSFSVWPGVTALLEIGRAHV